jgi:site-specific DNA recombinase
MSRRTIAYVRVSTDKQGDHGHSLEAQRAKVAAYAGLYDLDVVRVVEDVASAKGLERPGLAAVLEDLAAGRADALLVVKLDRLTRSVADLGTLVERCQREGWSLLSVSEQIDTASAAGRLVLNVLASVGQWEREAIGERTAAVMADMKVRGLYTGGRAPYGYRPGPDGQLEQDPGEQAVIGEIRRLRDAGLSYRAIVGELERAGLRNRTGSRFHPNAIGKVLGAAA